MKNVLKWLLYSLIIVGAVNCQRQVEDKVENEIRALGPVHTNINVLTQQSSDIKKIDEDVHEARKIFEEIQKYAESAINQRICHRIPMEDKIRQSFEHLRSMEERINKRVIDIEDATRLAEQNQTVSNIYLFLWYSSIVVILAIIIYLSFKVYRYIKNRNLRKVSLELEPSLTAEKQIV